MQAPSNLFQKLPSLPTPLHKAKQLCPTKPTVADYRTSNLLILCRPAVEGSSPKQEVGSSNLPGRAT
jgi:hypothetical protein